MLVAGGFGGKAMLWDARACKYPSMALPVRGSDVITSLCIPSPNLVVAGTDIRPEMCLF